MDAEGEEPAAVHQQLPDVPVGQRVGTLQLKISAVNRYVRQMFKIAGVDVLHVQYIFVQLYSFILLVLDLIDLK